MLYKDINLIPSKRSGTAPAKIVISILVVILVLSVIDIFFVYEPLKEKDDMQKELDSLNAVSSGYGNIGAEYIQARDEYNRYIERTTALRSLLKEDYTTMEEMEAFAYTCPPGVKIKNFNLGKGVLTVGCTAKSYEAIATYISGLEEFEFFEEVAYSTITYFSDGEDNEGYNFTLKIKVREKK